MEDFLQVLARVLSTTFIVGLAGASVVAVFFLVEMVKAFFERETAPEQPMADRTGSDQLL